MLARCQFCLGKEFFSHRPLFLKVVSNVVFTFFPTLSCFFVTLLVDAVDTAFCSSRKETGVTVLSLLRWLGQLVSELATWLSFGLRTSDFPLKSSCTLPQNHLDHTLYPVFRVLIPGTRDWTHGTERRQETSALGVYGQPDFLELASPSWEET